MLKIIIALFVVVVSIDGAMAELISARQLKAGNGVSAREIDAAALEQLQAKTTAANVPLIIANSCGNVTCVKLGMELARKHKKMVKITAKQLSYEALEAFKK